MLYPDVDYLSKIIRRIKRMSKDGYSHKLKLHFIFRNIVTCDFKPPPALANKLGLKPEQEIAPAGLAPRLTLARSECYWLLISIPLIYRVLKQNGLEIPFEIYLSYPESITMDERNSYVSNPLLLVPKDNIQQAIDFMHDFAQNGEDPCRAEDFIFNFDQFFHLKPKNGFLPIDHNSLMFMAGHTDNVGLRTMATIALNKAEEKDAMILERPRFWITDYNQKTFGCYGDAKSFAKQICPEYYPPSYEGRDVKAAESFFKEHEKIVIKPPSSANGQDVQILTSEHLESFPQIFDSYLKQYPDPQRIIIQKYLSGIEKHGEIRIFIYDNQIMPVGIRLTPENGATLCKIFMNAQIEPVLLSERYLRIAQKFIEGSKDRGLYYYGLDIIEDKNNKLYLTEANFLVSGFFDRMAYYMDTQLEKVAAHIATLPHDLQKLLIKSHLNDIVFKQVSRFLETRYYS